MLREAERSVHPRAHLEPAPHGEPMPAAEIPEVSPGVEDLALASGHAHRSGDTSQQ
jgi:hypothetical protein